MDCRAMTQSGDEMKPDRRPAASNLRAIFEDQYVLLLAVRPGDETRCCGGFIAESCARGRPPFVCIVTDGSSDATAAHSPDQVAQWRAERSRAATAMLDLPEERLLLFGLYDDSVPQADPLFERLVGAVADIARRYDCNVLCAPFQPQPGGDYFAVHRLAQTVVARADLTLIWYGPPAGPLDQNGVKGYEIRRLDIAGHVAQKQICVQTVNMLGLQSRPTLERSANDISFETFLLHTPAKDAMAIGAQD
jgi:LmbE family N-acetylglucosaminyl deacetylase